MRKTFTCANSQKRVGLPFLETDRKAPLSKKAWRRTKLKKLRRRHKRKTRLSPRVFARDLWTRIRSCLRDTEKTVSLGGVNKPSPHAEKAQAWQTGPSKGIPQNGKQSTKGPVKLDPQLQAWLDSDDDTDDEEYTSSYKKRFRRNFNEVKPHLVQRYCRWPVPRDFSRFYGIDLSVKCNLKIVTKGKNYTRTRSDYQLLCRMYYIQFLAGKKIPVQAPTGKNRLARALRISTRVVTDLLSH